MGTTKTSGYKRILARVGMALSLFAALVSIFPQTASAHPPQVSTYRVKGVSVTKYTPAHPNGKNPIVMVHGGSHASWAWEKYATELSNKGYETHAISWYNHGDSKDLPQDEFLKRSITDVARQEITYVVNKLDRKPILIGHSMGGLAALAYAEKNPVKKLVLLAPVMPQSVGAEPIPVPVDPTVPFGPFPYEVAKDLYFTTLPEADARYYHSLLTPESPQAVIEATQWSVDINLSKVKAPTMIISAELDALVPPAGLARMADMMDATYKQVPGIGHSDLLLKDPEWKETVHSIYKWLK